ncbi:MAG: cyclic pyranopterin monophosphate synthase MoaC [Gemmataceae bacterium]
MPKLSHFDDSGASRMVDVSAKSETVRTAVASAIVRMKPETLTLILDQKLAKGNVFEVARLAGIMAAKKTADLIPLCHPLAISSVNVDIAPLESDSVSIRATVKITGKTGVEMEALTAVTVSALTVYDMAKAVDRGMTIEQVRLEEKSGGKSGDFRRTGGRARKA